ncbi:MAG: hypothetical protein AB7I30_01060 [Isosphaeraceae bacterium]
MRWATRGGKVVGWSRWTGVLPAAALAWVVTEFLAKIVGRLAVSAWGRPDESHLVHALVLLSYLPKAAAFVVAGAKVAPRGRVPAAIGLASLAMFMSFVVHVATRSHPGVVNFTHFALESTGSGLGLAYVVFSDRNRPA